MSTARRQLWALIRTYVLLGVRGRTLARWERRTKAKSLLTSLIVYAILGALISLPGLIQDAFTFSLIAHTATFSFLVLILVSETPELLFSEREADVIGPRPVSPRALLAAKAASFYAFALLVAAALNFFPSLIGAFARGARPWFGLAHLTSTALLTLLCAASVVLACALLLRFVKRERFDTIASWGQALVLVAFVLGNQFLARFSRVASLEQSNLFIFFPPAWAASFDAVLCGYPTGARARWYVFLIVVLPSALAAFAILRLGTAYGKAIEGARTVAARPYATDDRTFVLWRTPLALWVKNSAERAAFELMARYLVRDRNVRLRVVPAVSICVAFPILGVISGQHDYGGRLYVPLTVAMMGTLSSSVMSALELSPQPDAAQIFYVAPLKTSARLFHGIRKAVFVLTVLPLFVLNALVVAFVMPHGLAGARLALPLLPLLPAMSLIPGLLSRYLPLSRGPRLGVEGAASLALALVSFFVELAAVFAGWVLDHHGWLWPALGAEILLLAAAHPLLLRLVDARQGRLTATA